MIKTAMAFLILGASVCLGQLEVKSASYYHLQGLGEITEVGSLRLADSVPTITAVPVAVIRIDTKAANVEVICTDVNREPYQALKVSPQVWVIDKPGKWWVDVTAIDFSRAVYGRKSLTVVVGDPGPAPPDPTPPNPPSPVPNDYGVGSVAYTKAPRDFSSARQYEKVYRQAGDFLFGVPTLKFVTSSNDVHAKDPNRSVLAWITQQYGLIQCTDAAVCKQWAEWRSAVSAALIESQKKRAYTKQDWYNAFIEIATALEAVK